MKFLLTLYIALGLMLSGMLGIEYSCNETEFTRFYGNPFVYKETSLGSSLTYFYSIYGIAMNTLIWSIVLYQLRRLSIYFLRTRLKFDVPKMAARISLIVILLFCTLTIWFSCITMGNGFEKGLNYWYIDVEETEERWDLNCEGEMMWN